jgi:hypothetical protein
MKTTVGASAAVAEAMTQIVDKALSAAQEVWGPRLEAAMLQLETVKAELAQERRRHGVFLEMATSRQRSDELSLETQRSTITQLQADVDQLLAKLRHVQQELAAGLMEVPA